MRYEREAKALTKALAPYRSGVQGERRARVRCTLVRLMGFRNCDDIPVGISKIPHHFPRESGLDPEERYVLAMVAYDALLDLGYEAAAAILTYHLRNNGDLTNLDVQAKEALANLEGGPPSVVLDSYPIITKTIRRYKTKDGTYLVGRRVGDTWWYRFVKGRAVHNNRGDYVGWDEDAGYTFQRRGQNLADVLAAKYGSSALT